MCKLLVLFLTFDFYDNLGEASVVLGDTLSVDTESRTLIPVRASRLETTAGLPRRCDQLTHRDCSGISTKRVILIRGYLALKGQSVFTLQLSISLCPCSATLSNLVLKTAVPLQHVGGNISFNLV